MIDKKIVKDIICLGIMVVVFLSAYSITLIIQQTALAQQKQTSTGNVTAQVAPQGTSLQIANKTAASTNITGTTTPSGNVTAQVAPQGTSLQIANKTAASTNITGTTTPSGNVTAQVAPQGTSLKTSNATTTTTTTPTSSSNNKLDCSAIASNIGGIAVPNPSKICHVLILRQAPVIIVPGNMNMNKFSTINSILEVASVSDLMTKSNGGGGSTTSGGSSANNTNAQNVFVMGEFALLEPQLVPMVKAAVGSNWTIAAVHNHILQEKPKIMFVHWSAQGDLNTITNQIKNVLLIVSKVPSSGS
jgi:hypothetical protein